MDFSFRLKPCWSSEAIRTSQTGEKTFSSNLLLSGSGTSYLVGPRTDDGLLVDAHHRFPDNFEKLSPPILQLDEVEFYYSKDQRLFTGLNLSADLESRICIVCVSGGTGTNQRASLLKSQVDLRLISRKNFTIIFVFVVLRSVKMAQESRPSSNF